MQNGTCWCSKPPDPALERGSVTALKEWTTQLIADPLSDATCRIRNGLGRRRFDVRLPPSFNGERADENISKRAHIGML